MGKIGRFWAKIKFLVKKLLKNLVVIKIMPTFALAIEKQTPISCYGRACSSVGRASDS